MTRVQNSLCGPMTGPRARCQPVGLAFWRLLGKSLTSEGEGLNHPHRPEPVLGRLGIGVQLAAEHLAPASGRSAKVHGARDAFEELKLLVDLQQLVR